MPISSSAHVAIVPWLLGWDYADLDPDLRKTFEVALHAGTAAGLMIARPRSRARRDLFRPSSWTWRDLWPTAVSVVPPAVAGYLLERPIERRLGTPPTIAAGLFGGALVMGVADRAPQRRRAEDATARDALWLGVAQAAALVPGISRGGAALAAARLREFTRRDAHRLSRRASAPVIGGATLLKALGARHRGVRQSGPAPLAAGACAAFASGLVSGRALDPDGPLWPYVAYRVALAALIVGRLGRLTSGR